jgi:hypothetical protein
VTGVALQAVVVGNGAGYDTCGRQLADRRWIYEYDAGTEAAALIQAARPVAHGP